MTYDLVVLGAGPGGYDCACEAAELGLKVALVEKDKVGGTCLNWGCVPTKLFLGATHAVEELAGQARIKVASGEIRVDFAALQKRKEKLLAGTRKAMIQRLGFLGVEYVEGPGRIVSPGAVEVRTEVGDETLHYRKLVVATGSRPIFFPGMEPDGKAVLDSNMFLDLEAMPESLVVIGAGFIGLEMAQAAHRFGAKIHVVDAMDRVAPAEHPEVSKALQSMFKRWKWDVRTGVRVASVKTVDGKAVLTLDSGDVIEAEKALVAVGRGPVSDSIGLEQAGVTLERGFIKVDGQLRATDDIYAIGDVNGMIQLAHAASHQAHYAAMHAAGRTDEPYASGPVPSVLYGAPEAMRVGRMPSDLKGSDCKVSTFMLAANPMAQAHAATQGFVKVIWSEGRVVGITAVGHDVSRLTTPSTMIVHASWTRDDIHRIVFPHPSLDEALMGALKAEQK
ncbi:dihydrolipoyl dehydrogenase family protein [Pseudodesulfovibrio tunisiensis]|uniref:dihydrolipoyl dehydrogenase family protein n=1 Tax=Pseudodesulfovibrio tunisiensis TaxID=463192 RepID=UPI001FB51933|nr:FAD-dependent oxidoreductase [Pseudodesulfovibrio tunisiensis]